MAKKSTGDRWLVAELSIKVPALTPEGRDALVGWMKATTFAIEKFKCDDSWSWSQPKRKYKLKVGY
jgi:hypothetical protein